MEPQRSAGSLIDKFARHVAVGGDNKSENDDVVSSRRQTVVDLSVAHCVLDPPRLQFYTATLMRRSDDKEDAPLAQ